MTTKRDIDSESNIYSALAQAREDFHMLELKKSGKNKFADYYYFQLADFVSPGLKCLKANGLVSLISFDTDMATMRVFGHGTSLTITSPMSSAALKGCHDVQNLGAVQTYLRRYLWMALLEIVEHDAFDSAEPVTAYTDAEAAKYDKLINDGDALAFCALLRNLPEQTRIALHNKWPAGQKTAMKKKAGELETRGGVMIGEYADGITEAVNGDDTSGLVQLADELTDAVKKGLVWAALHADVKAKAREMLAEVKS